MSKSQDDCMSRCDHDVVRCFVATERLGWPRRRWWHVVTTLFGEWQRRLHYEMEPETPTATCHLQLSGDKDAACGYPWELLVAVPGWPSWSQLPEWIRCDECEADTDPEQRP
jgi:hypothetical protein